MKKAILCLMLLIFSMILFSVNEPNPFDSFLGVKWGWSAPVAKGELERGGYKVKSLERWGGFSLSYYELNIQYGFYIKDMELGDLIIGSVMFGFEPSEDGIKWKEKNYPKFEFCNVVMCIQSNQFEPMLEILKAKYGKPKNSKEYQQQTLVYQDHERQSIWEGKKEVKTQVLQHEVTWVNENRMIVLYKYSTKNADRGFVMFDKIDEDKTKEAADIL